MKENCLISVMVKFFMVFMWLCLNTAFIYGTNIVVVPTTINFDCESASNEHDAITICDNSGDAVVLPEWNSYVNQYIPLDFSVTQNDRVAYVRGQINPIIKVSFESNYKGLVHLLINLSYVGGNTDGIGTICNYFIPNYNTNLSNDTTLSLTGTLPDVGIHEFQWKWEIYAIPTNVDPNYCPATTIINTTHSYYTLFAAPLNPMSSPWAGVLDLACSWASGQTTETGVLASITNSLYNSGVEYNVMTQFTPIGYTDLRLNSLLLAFQTPTSVTMDCRDFSNFLQVLNRSLGVACNYNRTILRAYTYHILPAGSSNPDTIWWNYHQYGLVHENFVVDASLKLGPFLPEEYGILMIGDLSVDDYIKRLTGSIPIDVSEATGVCTVNQN